LEQYVNGFESNPSNCFYVLPLQNDFSKIVAKREAEGLKLPARLTLQKSVSTPSIIAVQDIANEVAIDGTSPVIPP